MASIAELVEQLKQATAGKQTVTVGGPLVSFSDVSLKTDQDSASDDHASTGSGSRSMESTQEVQPSKTVNDELVSRLIFDNARLTRRMDEIETRVSKRIEEQGSDLSGKLTKRVDELEKGVSVVIHDLLSLRRHVESNVDAKLKATIQPEDVAAKFQKLSEELQGITVDLSTCKNVLNNFFGVKQWPHVPGVKDALAAGATDSKIASNITSETNAALEPGFKNQRVIQEIANMAKSSLSMPVTPQQCSRHGSGPALSARVASQQPSQQPSQLPSQQPSPQASPVQSKFGSKCASPVRSCDPPYFVGAADRRASREPVMQPSQSGVLRCEARLHERRTSPDVPRSIPEANSVHCEAQLLDRMIAESEKTLGKIKMIAESKGLEVNASHGSEGRGSVTLPRGPQLLQRTDDKGVPRHLQSASVPSASPVMPRSRQT